MIHIRTEADGHITAKAVCHLCAITSTAKVWAIHGDHVQVTRPVGWTERTEREGRRWMQRLYCDAHATAPSP